MEVNGHKRCIGCMSKLHNEKTCSVCHLQQDKYQPMPKCLIPGTVLAERYVLGKMLGEGGTGITYIAWDKVLDLTVAIKEYYPWDLVSRNVIRGTDQNVYIYAEEGKKEYEKGKHKFLNEARHLSKFNQMDGIVSIRDFFYANNTAYIVMSYAKGPNVKVYVKEQGKIEGKKVLSLMEPVITSLAKIHRAGVIHRDISPDNLLFTSEDKLALIDFGAMRTRNSDITRSITIMFKQGFSPEEQYRVRGKQGAWSDVYALCATMYFMLTGKRPEDAIERVFEDELSLEDLDGIDLTGKQKNALIKGLSVRAEERYPSVELLIEDLYGEETSGEGLANEHPVSGRKKVIPVAILAGVVCFAISGFALSYFEKESVSDVAKTETSVVVAKEPEKTPEPVVCKMPDCVGLTKKAAKAKLVKLEEVTFSIKWKSKYSSTVKKGKIIRQSIKKNTVLDEKNKVTFVISKGKKKTIKPEATNPPVTDTETISDEKQKMLDQMATFIG